jgi:hypothetical protein
LSYSSSFSFLSYSPKCVCYFKINSGEKDVNNGFEKSVSLEMSFFLFFLFFYFLLK